MLIKLSRLGCALILIVMLALANHIEAKPLVQENNDVETVKGTFEVNMQPQNDSDFAAGRMTLDKSYSGPLEATAKGQMLSHITTVKGSAGYVAIEHVEGSLNGKVGSFVLQHNGVMSKGEQALSVTIIADSGTGELEGIQGEMLINIVDGAHFYTLNYTL